MEELIREHDKGPEHFMRGVNAFLFPAPRPDKKKGLLPLPPSKASKAGGAADLGSVPRPYLVAVANSLGLFTFYMPTIGLRLQ
jgi:hypothetical protein